MRLLLSLMMFACVLLAAIGLAPLTACGADPTGVSLPRYTDTIAPFFKKHCLSCHQGEDAEGEMPLDQLSPVVGELQLAETWQEVLDVLNAGEMPPKDEPQPTQAELAKVIGVMIDGLFEARKRLVDTRHVTIRRLNRREYENTIRDLLGVPIDTVGLPADGTLDGFDTVGDAHFMSTVQFEKYLELGKTALDRALIAGPRPEQKINRVEPEVGSNKKAFSTLGIDPGTLQNAEDHFFSSQLSKVDRSEAEKQSNSKVQAQQNGARGYLAQPAAKTGFILDITQRPFGGQSHDKAWVSLPGKSDGAARLGYPIGRYVARFRVGLTSPPEPGQRLFVELVRTDTFNAQVTYSYPLGSFEVSHTIDDPQIIEVPFENLGETGDRIAVIASEMNNTKSATNRDLSKFPDSTKLAYVWVDWLEVEGPIIDEWPPTAWRDTIFKGEPQKPSNESTYAREIIERFAFRAFRHRKPAVEYVDRIHGLYRGYREDGMSFLDAIKESLSVVLASPSFVYLVEQHAEEGESSRRLSELELATRLSYFLWSHPPDDQLYELAENGRLSQPAVLRQQVERMLNDPKARFLAEAFTSQWLELDWLDMIVVNKTRFPDFNETLRGSFREEPIQFLNHLIRHDLSVKNLIDSDFVMVDDQLSRFYGLEAASGRGFQKVNLPTDSPRGGLLGQGAILTMTGTGERTSPVERGVFVYSRLLGRPVPPPPPNVPQLEIDSEQPLTVRETLKAHVEKAQCASCHRRMDPLGFGLEHFNAIGQWRDFEAPLGSNHRKARKQNKSSLDIDATGVMPDGTSRFDGHEQLKTRIMQNADGLSTGLLKSMLTYALGRRVGFADGDFVDRLHTNWKQQNYGMRTLIHAITQSPEFQSR